MKKSIYTIGAFMFASASLFAQPVHDRGVVPVAVTLNQVLRLNITNGGNIEFVFNQIDQYKNGLGRTTATAPASGDFYETNITVASSTRWELLMGAEDATLIGTDNPASTMALNNVGFRIIATGANSCCAIGSDITTSGGNHLGSGATAFADAAPNALTQYTGAGPVVISSGTLINAGDELDNVFEILWECGTTLTTGTISMSSVALIDAAIAPDRYVTNVFMDINGTGF